MTTYERERAWALAHPERVRASKAAHMRRKRAELRATDPDFRRPEYEATKFKRAMEATP